MLQNYQISYYKMVQRCMASSGVTGDTGRGSTTPPALNVDNYLTIRALSYAVSLVCRPPAYLETYWSVTLVAVTGAFMNTAAIESNLSGFSVVQYFTVPPRVIFASISG